MATFYFYTQAIVKRYRKIVKRAINEILVKAGLEPVNDDMRFIKRAEVVAKACGYKLMHQRF